MTDTWPPRWDRPNFKQAGSRKVARGLKREKRLAGENSNKAEVRRRDKYCRFPLCGCKRFQLALHVAHGRHKGMGGNPAEDRSEPDSMVLVCSARHKENVFSIDRKTIRWRALTPEGSNGPIAWEIAVDDLLRSPKPELMHIVTMRIKPRTKWLELARETGIHVYEPSTADQTVILAWLRSMQL